MRSFITGQLKEASEVKKEILEDEALVTVIESVARKCVDVYTSGH